MAQLSFTSMATEYSYIALHTYWDKNVLYEA